MDIYVKHSPAYSDSGAEQMQMDSWHMKKHIC